MVRGVTESRTGLSTHECEHFTLWLDQERPWKSCSGGQALGVYSVGNCAGVKPGRGGIRDHLGGSLWLQVEHW